MNTFNTMRFMIIFSVMVCVIAGCATAPKPNYQSEIPAEDIVNIEASIVENIQRIVLKTQITEAARPTPTIGSVDPQEGSVFLRVLVSYLPSVDFILDDENIYLVDANGVIRQGSVLSNRLFLTELTPPAYVPVSIVQNRYSFQKGSKIEYDIFFIVPKDKLSGLRLMFSGRELLIKNI